ncbi:ATP-grasp domain-containing protein [Streptomyces sp. SP18CS02]|uniref:ATP-grasp domain-containing protein n=1 Tax=Streptomyces sp. SP18CS02 TaxID=3002531 RepID=UPI002E79402D|nr:ATP-grasp domain-containing protein [Streptomyces sp. SP18CS02]MEE1752887.1 ATP-grasp domain-containing protein [Streptomyces sp. SP18CS02]
MRVLVIGTNRMCHERLRDQGHELVLFVPRSRARREDATGPYAHVVVLGDGGGTGLWADIAEALHRSAPFDAVAAYNEHTYPLVQAVSERLGVPSTVDLELFERVLDKSKMRDVLDKHAIPSCRHAFARGRKAVLEAVAQIGPPCIVKPVDTEASVGVARVDAAEDIEAALHRVGAEHIERGVLVEEFLDGTEFSVEALSVGSRHHIVAITRKFTDEETFVSRGHVVPAPLSPEEHATVSAYVTRVLDAFGFHDCPSHTEVMLSDRGPRIIEMHNRVAGDAIMDLVHLSTGVDMYDLVARQSIGEDIGALLPGVIVHERSAAAWYADPSGSPTHILVEVQGIDQVRELPHVHAVTLLKEPGSPQSAVRQNFDRSGRVIAVGDSPRQALSRAREAIGKLRFVYAWSASGV